MSSTSHAGGPPPPDERTIALYLRNYCGIPAAQIGSAKLSDITLEHMIINSGVGRNLVHFSPPMKSFAEARERVVAMHHDSLAALGLSDIKIHEYVLPQHAWQWGLLFICLWCYGTFPFPDKIYPGSESFMYSGWSLGGNIDALARLASFAGPLVLPPMLAVHAAETGYMWWSRLRKHGVQINGPAAWLWLGNTFISGFACIHRFDELVQEKQKAKEGKH